MNIPDTEALRKSYKVYFKISIEKIDYYVLKNVCQGYPLSRAFHMTPSWTHFAQTDVYFGARFQKDNSEQTEMIGDIITQLS